MSRQSIQKTSMKTCQNTAVNTILSYPTTLLSSKMSRPEVLETSLKSRRSTGTNTILSNAVPQMSRQDIPKYTVNSRRNSAVNTVLSYSNAPAYSQISRQEIPVASAKLSSNTELNRASYSHYSTSCSQTSFQDFTANSVQYRRNSAGSKVLPSHDTTAYLQMPGRDAVPQTHHNMGTNFNSRRNSMATRLEQDRMLPKCCETGTEDETFCSPGSATNCRQITGVLKSLCDSAEHTRQTVVTFSPCINYMIISEPPAATQKTSPSLAESIAARLHAEFLPDPVTRPP